MAVIYLGTNNSDGASLGQNSVSLVSLYGKTPIVQQTAPTIVLSVDPTVSTSALVASLQSIAVYSASTVNRVVLALSNIGVYV
jgi:hypothetical protein